MALKVVNARTAKRSLRAYTFCISTCLGYNQCHNIPSPDTDDILLFCVRIRLVLRISCNANDHLRACVRVHGPRLPYIKNTSFSLLLAVESLDSQTLKVYVGYLLGVPSLCL